MAFDLCDVVCNKPFRPDAYAAVMVDHSLRLKLGHVIFSFLGLMLESEGFI